MAAFVGAVFGCLATAQLSELGLPSPIASALATVALCGALLMMRVTQRLPGEFHAAIYGGSFAGMTPLLWSSAGGSAAAGLPGGIYVLSLALLSGLAFALVAQLELSARCPLARGFGGRSGAIATAASLLFVTLAPLCGGDDSLVRASRAEIIDGDPDLTTLTFIACTVGMVVTSVVLRLPRLMAAPTGDRTLAAAALALGGLSVLHLYGLREVSGSNGFYAGCFLGMSSPQRLRGWLQPVLGAIVLTAVLIEERGFLSGIGGSLGLAAFVTMLLLMALDRMLAGIAAMIQPRKLAPLSAASGHLLMPPIMGAMRLRPEPRLPAVIATPAGDPPRRWSMRFAPATAAVAIGALLLSGELAPQRPAPTVMVAVPAREPVPVQSARGQAASVATDATLETMRLGTGSIGPSAAAVRAAASDVTDDAVKLARSEPVKGDVTAAAGQESSEQLFREFMAWSASHPDASAQPAKPSGKRAAHPVAPAASTGAAHPLWDLPIHPSAAAGARPVAPKPATRP